MEKAPFFHPRQESVLKTCGRNDNSPALIFQAIKPSERESRAAALHITIEMAGLPPGLCIPT
jgi:hypothetical protein